MSRFKNRDKKNRTPIAPETEEGTAELDDELTEDAEQGSVAENVPAEDAVAAERLLGAAPDFDRYAYDTQVETPDPHGSEEANLLEDGDAEPFEAGDAVIVADEELELAVAAEQAAIARTQELLAEPAPGQFTVGRAIDGMLVYLDTDEYKAGGGVEGYDKHLASVGII